MNEYEKEVIEAALERHRVLVEALLAKNFSDEMDRRIEFVSARLDRACEALLKQRAS